jgi:hypothetical protein
MTIADLLFQAGFWQWVGMIILAGFIAKGVGNLRLWGDVVKNKTTIKNGTEAKP